MKKFSAALIIILNYAIFSLLHAQSTITLVIASDNDQIPVLSTAESVLRDTLVRMYPGAVQYVSTTKAASYDFSSSDLVVACSNIFAKGFADTLLNRGVNVALFGSALNCLNGEWLSGSLGYLSFTSTQSFLSGFPLNSRFSVSSGSMSYTESVETGEWVNIAVSNNYPARKVFFSSERSGTRGGVMGYNVTGNTDLGWDVFRRIIHWCMGEQFVIGAVVPQDSVAMVIKNLNDSTPVLSFHEEVLRDSLHSWGYGLYYVSYSRAGVSDFSKSKFVALCEQYLMSQGMADTLIQKGVSVVLFGGALEVIGTVNTMTNSNSTGLLIDSSIAFLEGYPVGALYELCTSSTYYGNFDWNILGRDSTKSAAFIKESGEVWGAALGYNTGYLTSYGWDVAKRMVKWITRENVVDVKTIPENHITMVIYSLDDDLIPTLSTEERRLRDCILDLGDSIAYISSSKVTVTDFSPSKLVVTALNTLSKSQADTLLANGINVALFGAGIQSLASRYSTSPAETKILKLSKAQAFMDGLLYRYRL